MWEMDRGSAAPLLAAAAAAYGAFPRIRRTAWQLEALAKKAEREIFIYFFLRFYQNKVGFNGSRNGHQPRFGTAVGTYHGRKQR